MQHECCKESAEDTLFSTALAALNSPLHQAITHADFEKTNRRRKYTVSDMRTYLQRIGLPFDDPKHCRNIIHITGTKGKGSTAAFCDSICRHAYGYRVGLFTSPHLVHICERIRIDGQPVSTQIFGKAYWNVRHHLENWKDNNFSSTNEKNNNDDLPILPGFFRMILLVALDIFASLSQPIQVLVLEVGMGGRYDCTNIFDHTATNTVCGVTLIDYDHVRILGSTLEQIAWEKGGIFLQNKDCNTSCYTQRPLDSETCVDEGIEEEGGIIDEHKYDHGNNKLFSIESNRPSVLKILQKCALNEGMGSKLSICRLGDHTLPDTFLGLAGTHQRINAELAISMCRSLQKFLMKEDSCDIDVESNRQKFYQALGMTILPGRCQTINYFNTEKTLKLILRCDGAHTHESIKACLEWFQDMSGYKGSQGIKGKRVMIFNCSHERDPVSLLRLAKIVHNNQPLFHRVYFCPLSSRPSPIDKLPMHVLLKQCGVYLDENQQHLPSTWTETLALIWKALCHDDDVGNLLKEKDENIHSNMTVEETLSDIRLWASSFRSNQDSIQVDVCVMGSLYLVGSVLSAVEG